MQNPESITQKKSNYFKRLKDEPSAWIRVSEMFPYEKPKQTAVGIASWKLSSAVLHIGFSRELSNVAHLDAQLFKTGMRLALTTRNGKRLLQSILSHLGVEPLLRMPWTQRCRVDRAMSYSALISRDGLPFSYNCAICRLNASSYTSCGMRRRSITSRSRRRGWRMHCRASAWAAARRFRPCRKAGKYGRPRPVRAAAGRSGRRARRRR